MHAQLGTDIFTLGADDANNYGGTWNTTNAGSGFSDWTFDTSGGGFQGRFIGSFSTALDVSSNSFGLFANSDASAVSGATINLPQTMQEGDVFKISVGVNFRDGNKGFDLRNSSNATVRNFNVGSDKYTLDGNDLFNDDYDANTVITFTFTQEASEMSWTAQRTGGLTDSAGGSFSGVSPGTITNIRLYNTSAGSNGDGGGARNLYFNSLSFTSRYTIPNSSSTSVTSDITAPYLTVESGGSVTVNSGFDLTVSGNLTNNGTLNLNSGSSMTISGTTSGTGNYSYARNLANGSQWYLMSSPVSGENYNNDWVTANSIPSSTQDTDNRGISWYDNSSSDTDSDGGATSDSATGYWRYMEAGNDASFAVGRGYGLIRSSSGDITFTGTGIYSTSQTFALTMGENNFNLVGNPFSASLNLGDFFADNGAGVISGAQVWFWNGSSYDVRTSGSHSSFEIAPTQGFFVEAAAATNLTFDIADVSHTAATFQRTSSKPEITLSLVEGKQKRNAYVYYIDGSTTSYDLGFDGKLFGGVSHNLAIYTDLIESNGNKYQLQALPNSNYESMVIPVGIIADAGKEITFTAEALNLPSGLKVFLEDRELNTITRLDEANSNYKITLNNALNGTGRFYLHTTSSALSVNDITLEGVNVFALNRNTLRINGVNSDKASLKLFNILGKNVLSQSFSSKGVSEVNLPNLSTGVYIVQLSTEKGKTSKKIVLE